MNPANNDTKAHAPLRPTLPAVPTSFVGRRREIVEISQLLTSSPVVSLVGAGGCGKTRIALRVAAEVSQQYADGVLWFELARVSDPELVPLVVAKTLKVVEPPDTSLLDTLLNALLDREMLLVLDNCEHLLIACAQLVEALVSAPELKILITSREPLGIQGEALYPVLPLAIPTLRQTFSEIGQCDAVQLFVERARSILPSFSLTPQNAEGVAAICRDLDGIPLAIELASARVNVLSVQQIQTRLNQRFDLLVSMSRREGRHQTLRATLDWSYELLTSAEQLLLRRLAVFAAGFTLNTAQAVCAWGQIPPEYLLELLSSLVNKSLVVAETLRGSEARYHLLETIRQYAHEKLIASDEWSATHDRYLDCFLRLIEEIAPKLREQYRQLWFNWLEGELDNLRAALAWSLERGPVEAGLRIANAISEFWWFCGYEREGRTWYERLLAPSSDDIPLLIRTEANSIVTHFLQRMGDHAMSKAQAEATIALAKQAGEDGKFYLAFAMGSLANSLRAIGDYAAAFEAGKRGIQLMRELGNPQTLAESLAIQAINAVALRKNDLGRRLLDEALSLTREQGNNYRNAQRLKALGDLARQERAYMEARSIYEQCLSVFRSLDAASDTASVLCGLAHTHLHLGNIERASVLLNESQALQRATGIEHGMAECVLGYGALAAVHGLYADAVRLLTAAVTRAAESILETYPGERLAYQEALAAARTGLTEQTFKEAQKEGRTLTMEQAVTLALSIAHEPVSTLPKTPKEPGKLTSRERDVTILVARGQSNSQIADQLVLSKRTVEHHIASILSKLGFTNRAQIVRWAIENGLTDAVP